LFIIIDSQNFIKHNKVLRLKDLFDTFGYLTEQHHRAANDGDQTFGEFGAWGSPITVERLH